MTSDKKLRDEVSRMFLEVWGRWPGEQRPRRNKCCGFNVNETKCNNSPRTGKKTCHPHRDQEPKPELRLISSGAQ